MAIMEFAFSQDFMTGYNLVNEVLFMSELNLSK